MIVGVSGIQSLEGLYRFVEAHQAIHLKFISFTVF